jgi:purine-cytosine permease-like protein
MILEYYKQLLVLAVFLLLFGCIMPFLMAIQVVESTFFLNFLSFGASVLGLFLGLAGIAGARTVQKSKADKDHYYK